MKNYQKIYNSYLEGNERLLIKHILPEYYIDCNINKHNISVDYTLRFLQNELNSILNSFINGGFSQKGFILYPFVKDVSDDNLNRLSRLKNIVVFLNNNGYNFSN